VAGCEWVGSSNGKAEEHCQFAKKGVTRSKNRVRAGTSEVGVVLVEQVPRRRRGQKMEKKRGTTFVRVNLISLSALRPRRILMEKRVKV